MTTYTRDIHSPTLTEVHPYAALFPRLDEDSLLALAEDIDTNGLREPITVTPDNVVLDGINRELACEIAGVDPTYVVYHGDPIPFIMSANLQRRDLSQGQKAHLAVVGLSNLDNRQTDIAKVAGVPQGRIAEAQIVAQWAPELAQEVIAGTLPHATAYEQAKEKKTTTEREALELADLKKTRPDLFEKYESGEIKTLIDAIRTRNDERIKEQKQQKLEQEAINQRNLNLHIGYTAWASLMHNQEQLERAQKHYTPNGDAGITGPMLRELGEFLIRISTTWRV